MPKMMSGGTRSMDFLSFVASGTRGSGAAGLARELRRERDVDHEAGGQQDAGDDAGDEQLADRVVGERAVDDHVDARRDQDAERAAGRERAERARSVVAALLEGGQGDRADRRGGRDRRAGGRREQRAAADVGVQQPARQPRQPGRQADVHPVGEAAAQQDLAEQDEQRDGGEQVLVLDAPDDAADRIHEARAEAAMPPAMPMPARTAATGRPMTRIATLTRKAVKTMVIDISS